MNSEDIDSILDKVDFETPMFKVAKLGIEHYKEKIKGLEDSLQKEEEDMSKSRDRAVKIITELKGLNSTDEEIIFLLKKEFEKASSK